MTMALSTSIPIAKINAPSDTRCKVPSNPFNTNNEPSTIVKRLKPMITPDLKPIVKISTMITMAMDSMRFTMKVEMASDTRSG